MYGSASVGHCCFAWIYYLFKASGHPQLRGGEATVKHVHLHWTFRLSEGAVGRAPRTVSRDLDSRLSFPAYSLYREVWIQVLHLCSIARLELNSRLHCLLVVSQSLGSGVRSLIALSVSLEGWQVALETFLVLQSLCSGFGQRSFQWASFIVFS